MLKVSFITTVFNEEKSIEALLDSLAAQTRKPDEVVIVDAGSTDNTIKIIKKSKPKGLKINLIILKGAYRSQGRNEAIKKAKHPLIVVSDAGCTLDPEWIERITDPFKNKSLDAVGGYYFPETNSIWQKSIVPFVAVMPDKFDIKTFLPSSRSLAFKRSAFNKVGGYPAYLNTCEDLVFAYNLKQQTNLAIKPEAFVYWRQVENLWQFFTMIKNHAQGDVQARYKPHLKKIITVFLRYALIAIFPLLLPVYLLFPIFKHFHYVQHPLALVYLPINQLTADLAVMMGTFKGLAK